MGPWIVLFSAVVLLFVWLLLKLRRYTGIFADAHMTEIAERFDSVRGFAYRLADEPLEPWPISPDDPRVAVTRKGVVLAYTIRRDGRRYVHHFSVSVAGAYTPPSVGGSLVIYLDSLLDHDHEQVEFGVSNGSVYHGEFQLEPDEEETTAHQPLALPDDPRTARRTCADVWRHTHHRRVRIRPGA
ncbi:MAG: hypothetical protein ACYS5V_12695 [Planctomycetota bacterium]|jgi:hypothetical protein